VCSSDLAPTGSYDPLTIFANDNDGGGSYNARLYFTPPTDASTIYLRASGLRRSDAGGYAIIVERVPPRAVAPKWRIPTLRTGRTIESAITLGDAKRGANRLYHRYKLNGRKDHTYTIDLRTIQFDALLEVFAETALGPQLIDRNDDVWPYVVTCSQARNDLLWQGCLNSRLEISFQKGGTVYLDVTSPNAMSTGNYVLMTSKGRKN
jgi:hypothetical protein